MDSYEATRIVYSKIQILDPENASKIMGLLLIQDHGEKDIIRLAFGPESLLHSVILKAKNDLGLQSSHTFHNFDDQLINPLNLPIGSSSFSTGVAPATDLIDDFQFSFLNDGSPTAGDPVHRRSCSVNDLGTEDLNCGLGWKPCLYYARGFCKNGTTCRFLHGGVGDSDPAAASPSKIEIMDHCHELLRSKSSVQQRLHLMAYSLQHQRNDSQRATAAAAAALMMGEDLQKFNRFGRVERNDIVNPASRQIYLTFPADSSFKEEDVSSYFSIYGPVQDVRIPYQQKRMFGFVTFVYPETVKLILAKGNPHFVCDARVLVKPYKEKGKVPDKFRKQQQIDRDFSPTGLDSRELYDHLQLGSRMFYNSPQDLLWRRKLEEQQADLDLQSRRLLNMQLLDVKKNQLHHHRALSTGSPIPSPTHSPNPFAQSLNFPTIRSTSSCSNSDILGEIGTTPRSMASTDMPRQPSPVYNGSSPASEFLVVNDKERSQIDDTDLLECFEHNLPDSLFASPAKATGDTAGGDASSDSDDTEPILASASSLEVATSFKSYNCQMPRFPSGHGAIGMYAGTGGPTCPVGI